MTGARVLAGVALALVAVLVLITLMRVERAWPREAHLSHVEGIWIGLARDVSEGTWYRPLEGPTGYGGTRYFPLFFTLHGALIRAGVDPVIGGQVLSAASVVLLLTGVFLLLRRLNVDRVTAMTAAAVALGCQPIQMAMLSIRGDALPAAFVLLGLAACAGGAGRASPAIFFTLAFATKPTSLYAPAAAVCLCALTGRRRDGIRLALLTLAGVAATLVAMQITSGGTALETIAASAGGGTAVNSALRAPLSLARILRRVPETTFFVQMAAALLLVRLFRPGTVAESAWVCALLATLVIYASPATIENHLIDLAVLSVVVLAALAGSTVSWRPAVLSLLIVGGVASAATASWRSVAEDTLDLRTRRQAVLRSVGEASSRMLTDQPMLEATAGVSPYLLDPYLLSVRLDRDPSAIDRLIDDLERAAFDAVVLGHESLDVATDSIFPGEAADRFRRSLVARYRLDAVVEGSAIYRPR